MLHEKFKEGTLLIKSKLQLNMCIGNEKDGYYFTAKEVLASTQCVTLVFRNLLQRRIQV